MAADRIPVGPRPQAGTRDARLRQFLIFLGLAAIVVAAIAQALMPAHGNRLVAWLVTVVLPGLIVGLLIANRRNRLSLLLVTCGLIYVEAILLASLYMVGIAFAILLPMIGIGLVQPYVQRQVKLAAYAGAVVVATVAVILAEAGVPANPLGADYPLLAVTAFGLVATFALGLTWHAGERLLDALEAAGKEIAARVEAERQLSQSAQTLETLIRSSPVATMALDVFGRITVWNPSAERLFGWDESEVLGSPLPFVREGLREAIETTLGGGEIQGAVYEVAAREGQPLTVEVHSAPRRDERGRLRGVIVQAIDVGQRAALEAQLRDAQRLEAVGHLAGGVAHDVNNTLTAVGGFAELIEAETRDPRVQEDARLISAAVERASELTRHLLAFARRSMLRPEAVAVHELVAAVEPMLRGIVRPEIETLVDDAAGDAVVLVDRSQFVHALLNLINNALEAMPEGGQLTIAARREPDERADAAGGDRLGKVVVAVTDTGVGIPRELQGQVFEPFFTTKERGKGTGLGLAMVYGFVRQSGGEIGLRSVPGEGTTIEIRLPEVASAAARPAPGPRRDEPARGTETVLLIEDDPDVSDVGSRILAGLGYDVLRAASGPEAISLARERKAPISLVLSDVVMPGMSGPEAAEAVKTIHPEAAVLYASGYTADTAADRSGLPAGAELVQKPYTVDGLARRVRRTLDARAAAVAPEGSPRPSPELPAAPPAPPAPPGERPAEPPPAPPGPAGERPAEPPGR